MKITKSQLTEYIKRVVRTTLQEQDAMSQDLYILKDGYVDDRPLAVVKAGSASAAVGMGTELKADLDLQASPVAWAKVDWAAKKLLQRLPGFTDFLDSGEKMYRIPGRFSNKLGDDLANRADLTSDRTGRSY